MNILKKTDRLLQSQGLQSGGEQSDHQYRHHGIVYDLAACSRETLSRMSYKQLQTAIQRGAVCRQIARGRSGHARWLIRRRPGIEQPHHAVDDAVTIIGGRGPSRIRHPLRTRRVFHYRAVANGAEAAAAERAVKRHHFGGIRLPDGRVRHGVIRQIHGAAHVIFQRRHRAADSVSHRVGRRIIHGRRRRAA